MIRTTLAQAWIHRTLRLLEGWTQQTPLAVLLDPNWDRSIPIYPGMVAMKTAGDNVTLINAVGDPMGFFGEFVEGYGVDEPKDSTVNATAVWAFAPDAQSEVLAPAFDTGSTWVDPGDGTVVLAHAIVDGARRGKMAPAGQTGRGTLSAKPVARLIRVDSPNQIVVAGLNPADLAAGGGGGGGGHTNMVPTTIALSTIPGPANGTIVGGDQALSDGSDASYVLLSDYTEGVLASFAGFTEPVGQTVQSLDVVVRLDIDEPGQPGSIDLAFGTNFYVGPLVDITLGDYPGNFAPFGAGPGIRNVSFSLTDADMPIWGAPLGATLADVAAVFAAGNGKALLIGNAVSSSGLYPSSGPGMDTHYYEIEISFVYA